METAFTLQMTVMPMLMIQLSFLTNPIRHLSIQILSIQTLSFQTNPLLPKKSSVRLNPAQTSLISSRRTSSRSTLRFLPEAATLSRVGFRSTMLVSSTISKATLSSLRAQSLQGCSVVENSSSGPKNVAVMKSPAGKIALQLAASKATRCSSRPTTSSLSGMIGTTLPTGCSKSRSLAARQSPTRLALRSKTPLGRQRLQKVHQTGTNMSGSTIIVLSLACLTERLLMK